MAAGEAEELHTLRKQLKKLRYTAELAAGLTHRKHSKAYLAQLSTLQDALGALNDLHESYRFGLTLRSVLSPRPGRELVARLDALSAEVLGQRSGELAEALERFAHEPPFWS